MKAQCEICLETQNVSFNTDIRMEICDECLDAMTLYIESIPCGDSEVN